MGNNETYDFFASFSGQWAIKQYLYGHSSKECLLPVLYICFILLVPLKATGFLFDCSFTSQIIITWILRFSSTLIISNDLYCVSSLNFVFMFLPSFPLSFEVLLHDSFVFSSLVMFKPEWLLWVCPNLLALFFFWFLSNDVLFRCYLIKASVTSFFESY